jgi:hypothetical protein
MLLVWGICSRIFIQLVPDHPVAVLQLWQIPPTLPVNVSHATSDGHPSFLPFKPRGYILGGKISLLQFRHYLVHLCLPGRSVLRFATQPTFDHLVPGFVCMANIHVLIALISSCISDSGLPPGPILVCLAICIQRV